MYRLLYISLVAAASCLTTGCAGSCTTPTRADEARERACIAAQRLIDTDHSDTMSLQRSILEAKAEQSEYAIAGDTLAVKAFDEAFGSYLAEHDAGLAGAIF